MVIEDRSQIHRSGSRILEAQQRRRRALKIVNRYTLLLGGIGLISSPLLYQAAVGGLVGKMLYDLNKLYGTSMTEQKSKAIIASVLGGAHSEWITSYLGNTVKKVLPNVSTVGNAVVRPVVAAGITYAIGKLFIKHFESGAWLKETSAENVPHLPGPSKSST